MNAEAESPKKEYDQLPSVKNVSEYRWPKKEKVSNLDLKETVALE
jgi:hypothetical protein